MESGAHTAIVLAFWVTNQVLGVFNSWSFREKGFRFPCFVSACQSTAFGFFVLVAAGCGSSRFRQAMAPEPSSSAAAASSSSAAAHLTMSEAHVARTISDCLPDGDGLFVGNSMPIRDLDMFAGPNLTNDALKASFVGAPIAANRGASGIDGVLSSAAGFADGLQRKCTLVIGDVSFIHDTNGLNLLRTGGMSPALTVVLINNSGGGIFNFLPIAGGVPDEQFRPLWTTPQYVDIAGMCRAQGIPHMRVTSLAELEKSLRSSWALNRHCVLEVVTNIESNVCHHDEIKEAVSRALDGIVEHNDSSDNGPSNGRGGDAAGAMTTTTISRVRVRTESFPLRQPMTTAVSDGASSSTRDVAHILMDVLCSDGTPRRVTGEVAPLPGLHRETIEEAVTQASHVAERLHGVKIPEEVLRSQEGMLASLLQAVDGDSLPSPLYPSVACGLEAALFQIHQATATTPLASTPVSALLNPHGKSADDIASEARHIVHHRGYTCIKVKAGRATDPAVDAEYLSVIREAVGDAVVLRVDANQAWTASQAATYVEAVADLGVEYLEEPLANPSDLMDWKHTGVPIALDESIDQGVFDPRDGTKPLPEAVKVVVVKPSLLGGLSATLALSRAASRRGLRTIISSSFESPLGLLHLSQIARVSEGLVGSRDGGGDAHGISTESWFAHDYSGLTFVADRGRMMPADVRLVYDEPTSLWSSVTDDDPLDPLDPLPVASFSVATKHVEWHVSTSFEDVGRATGNVGGPVAPIVLLHGMFGSSAEMHDLASALRRRCQGAPVLCVDLPGHGQSRWTDAGLDKIGVGGSGTQTERDADTPPDMLELMSVSLAELLQDDRLGSCTLVGYSLGARLALATYLRDDGLCDIERLVTISGGLGVDDHERRDRAAKDDAMAASFERLPRQEFFNAWYGAPLWDSMRQNPGFARYVAAKALAGGTGGSREHETAVLAATLRGCSPGRVASLRDALDRALENEGGINDTNTKNKNNNSNEPNPPRKIHIHMIVGSKDTKYTEMVSSLETSTTNEHSVTVVVVDGAGHAAHLEAPDAVASEIASAIAAAISTH